MLGDKINKRQETRDKKQSGGFIQHLFVRKDKQISLSSKKGAGFTLIEIIVVLAIFTILGVLITNVFLLSLKAQRQSTYRQETLANLRFVMETMAQNIRTHEIDYNFEPDNQTLNLRLGTDWVTYSLEAGEIVLTTGTESGSQSDLLTTADDVVVFEMNFFVDPPIDPFTDERCNNNNDCLSESCTLNILNPSPEDFKAGFCNCSSNDQCDITNNCNLVGLCLPIDRQPRVTVSLGFTPAGPLSADQQPLYLQTTVSSRVYKR